MEKENSTSGINYDKDLVNPRLKESSNRISVSRLISCNRRRQITEAEETENPCPVEDGLPGGQ